jgi:ribonuclease inhibitor
MDMVVIDFSDCKSTLQIHAKLKEALEFPDYYGKNWSALWDMLTGYLDYPMIIKLKGLNSLPLELNNSVETLLIIFRRAVKVEPELRLVVED